jgi:fructoselysine-6-P-deglycase FrlB-like protein
MSYVDQEIASQPECWRRTAALAVVHERVLPQAGERVAVVGCGTSWFMAQAYAALRERAGHGETHASAASEFTNTVCRYDRVVAITRSGTTTEVLAVLDRLGSRVPTVAICADGESPATRLAAHCVVLDYADERSVVQTRFATTTLALLRTHLGEDIRAAVADAESAVTGELAVDPDTVEQVTFLGRGWTVGLAAEAALKCREAASMWTEAYPAMEYRHGPISIAAPGRIVWVLGDVPAGLADEVRQTGGQFVHSGLDPLAELVRVQRFAVAAAVQRGLDPDHPRHLTRSVVLG